MKYIVVTGGVLSGIGKGVIASSTGALLQAHGIPTTIIKIDPYVNIDAGTLSPLDHGEVFVLADGTEVDLDLGNYERFMNLKLTKDHSITTGKIYNEVIKQERRGDYLGKTVQIVPHLTNLIQEKTINVSEIEIQYGNEMHKEKPEVCIIELGGTIGDIEGYVFVEALRQLKAKVGLENIVFVSVEYIPKLSNNEYKTKPLQNGVKQMKTVGIFPDFIMCRSEGVLDKHVKEKISTFCEVPIDHLIHVPQFDCIYKAPGFLETQNYSNKILDRLNIKPKKLFINFNRFDYIFNFIKKGSVCIAIVGKYIKHRDSYISVENALNYSAKMFCLDLKINWIEAQDIENDNEKAIQLLKEADGVLIPGGFGTNGTEGKVKAVRYARENNVPLFGICLGFQVAVIEFCRNVLGLENATSEEFNEKAIYKVIRKIKRKKKNKMRLGEHKVHFTGDSRIKEIHGSVDFVNERHRHRFKVNNKYLKQIQDNGMHFVASNERGSIMQIFELKDHAFFVGAQHHPEFNTNPEKPHSLFTAFIKASFECKK
ncbi:CTP synthase ura7 [Gurleya vavrai]